MGKIVVSEFMSLDGVIGSPNAWQFPFQSEEMGEITERQNHANEILLLGKSTYNDFAGFWPTMKNNEFGISDKLNSMPKYVVSTTLQTAEWNNTTIIKSNVIEEIRKLKQQSGGQIGLIGSAKLVHSLLDAGLIDEVQVFMHPLVLGEGVRLFVDGGRPSSMKLADSKVLSNGVIFLSYQIEPQS